uniref:Uncharacterized protein n=1 Tax=Trichogramma kaykai TaxID=54128 RepID=A0ABD2VVH6_9HYME
MLTRQEKRKRSSVGRTTARELRSEEIDRSGALAARYSKKSARENGKIGEKVRMTNEKRAAADCAFRQRNTEIERERSGCRCAQSSWSKSKSEGEKERQKDVERKVRRAQRPSFRLCARACALPLRFF